jgi:HD-like signal output (HDOD) protein
MPEPSLTQPMPSALSWAAWLEGADIPVLRTTANAIAAMATRPDETSAARVAEVVMGDPLMTARLFAKLGDSAGRRRSASIGSVTTAVVMMGLDPFFAAFGRLPTVGERLRGDPAAQQGLLAVVRRAIRAAHYARDWAVMRQDLESESIMMAALLHELAEMLLWCAAPAFARRVRAMLSATPGLRSAQAQQAVLGTTLPEIQAHLMTRLHLPALLVRLAGDTDERDTQARIVRLAVALARHSAKGWDDPALPDDFAELARIVRVSPRRALEMVHPLGPDAPVPAP